MNLKLVLPISLAAISVANYSSTMNEEIIKCENNVFVSYEEKMGNCITIGTQFKKDNGIDVIEIIDNKSNLIFGSDAEAIYNDLEELYDLQEKAKKIKLEK